MPEPLVSRVVLVVARLGVNGPILVDVVEQPSRLVLLDVEPVSRMSLREWWPASTTLGLIVSAVPSPTCCMSISPTSKPISLSSRTRVGDVQGDVRRERLGLRQCAPQLLVAGRDPFGDLARFDAVVEILARLQVVKLAGDVRDGDLDVVAALAVGKGRVQVARLRVDQVGRELGGVASEQGVRKGDVSPIEAREVQPAPRGRTARR